MSGCNIEQCIPCLWTVPCPFSLRGDRGRRFRNDAFAGSLVWNFTGFFRLCYECIGKEFLGYSIVATASFSISYRIYEQFPYIWPQLAQMPLLASVLGAVFVGVGAGLCVRIGGAPGGDDALAMSISYVTKWKIQWVYLLTDAIVLGLSLSYIPVKKIGYSILTVLLSGQIIGLVQKVHMPQTGAGSAVNELE